MSLNKFFNVDTGFDILKMNIGADEIKSNNIDATNITTTNINAITINTEPYPPPNPPQSSIFYLNPNEIGGYDPLPVSFNKGIDYLLTSGSLGNVLEIKTINLPPYNGYRIRLGSMSYSYGSILIRHNDPSQNPAEQKYPIITNTQSDINISPVAPVAYLWVDLIYNEDFGGRAWICSVVQGS
jgi:hypothetical protein